MSKVEINAVAEAAKSIDLPAEKVRELLDAIANLQEPEEEKAPAIKKQFVVLVSDPEGRLPKFDFVAWVLQIPESESVATTQDRLFRSAYDFNASKKGRLLPVKSVGEAIENVPSRFFNEADLWVRTKTPVLVLRTDNQIPKDSLSYTIRHGDTEVRIDRDGISSNAA